MKRGISIVIVSAMLACFAQLDCARANDGIEVTGHVLTFVLPAAAEVRIFEFQDKTSAQSILLHLLLNRLLQQVAKAQQDSMGLDPGLGARDVDTGRIVVHVHVAAVRFHPPQFRIPVGDVQDEILRQPDARSGRNHEGKIRFGARRRDADLVNGPIGEEICHAVDAVMARARPDPDVGDENGRIKSGQAGRLQEQVEHRGPRLPFGRNGLVPRNYIKVGVPGEIDIRPPGQRNIRPQPLECLDAEGRLVNGVLSEIAVSADRPAVVSRNNPEESTRVRRRAVLIVKLGIARPLPAQASPDIP